MDFIGKALGWVAGIFFLLVGLGVLFDSLILGIAIILVALICLPPSKDWFYEKTKLKRSFVSQIGAAFAILIFGSLAGSYQESALEKKQAEQKAEQIKIKKQLKAEAKQKENLAYFTDNRETILSEAKAHLDNKKYTNVVFETKKYVKSNDKELLAIHNQATTAIKAEQEKERAKQAEIAKQAKIKALLAELKTIPASEALSNKSKYQQLMNLDPNNKIYANKVKHYDDVLKAMQAETARIAKKAQAERADRLARFGEEPKASGWDGSYYEVKTYLKQIANDPDSIKMVGCTNVKVVKNGWLVGCEYRGKNAFGALIRNSNWFIIRHGRVVSMHDSSTYR